MDQFGLQLPAIKMKCGGFILFSHQSFDKLHFNACSEEADATNVCIFILNRENS